MSKGSKQRPSQVSNEEYSNRWNEIFGHDLDLLENNTEAYTTEPPATEHDNSRSVS